MIDKFWAIEATISGLVQGVGFRPFVYRLATDLQLHGDVRNQVDGVRIRLEGSSRRISDFLMRLESEAPAAASIRRVETVEIPVRGLTDFRILQSGADTGQVTRVSPDLPVCSDCLEDMQRDPRRIDYPFTNCTNCGPRFSIVRELPYDRALTTMASFEMCEECRSEYHDIADRRFHAQPVACNVCGPEYQVLRKADGEPEHDSVPIDSLLRRLCAVIDGGGTVALKGLGGYHLVCDATRDEAVRHLREGKRREAKPFAIMVKDVGVAQDYACVGDDERALLESPMRPIVLLRRRAPEGNTIPVSNEVTSGLNSIGIVLPYMPLHHQLFDHLRTPAIVLTSGNLSSEPIVRTDDEAMKRLAPICSLAVGHNREIHNRLDDSVALVAGGSTRVLRRARGYVPTPITLSIDVDDIVALGAEQKNTLCFGSGHEAILSQHIGDVDDPETLDFLHEILDRFPRLFRTTPRLVAVDHHPDYASGEAGRKLGLPVREVWHHHAHVASCMAEHGLDGQVLGVALDGTGYGEDGTIWGGEFFVAGLARASRYASFQPVRIPGGDLAAAQPWRSALAYLMHAFDGDIPGDAVSGLAPFTAPSITTAEREASMHAIRASVNAPFASSTGRLFDAIAAITGVCLHSSFDAEAPIRLTDLVEPEMDDLYPFTLHQSGDANPAALDFDRTIRHITRDVLSGKPVGLISTMFHNTISEAVTAAVRLGRERSGLNRVVLSGGVFQNWYLLETTERRLRFDGFEVYAHSVVPSNDGGISLGQLVIAAAARSDQE